jgi:hypothetical protein
MKTSPRDIANAGLFVSQVRDIDHWLPYRQQQKSVERF